MADSFAPGMIVIVRDEEWLVTEVNMHEGVQVLRVRGMSDFVRDQEAIFCDCFDRIEPLHTKEFKVKADTSDHYRKTRLWLETVYRKTSVPITQDSLTVSEGMFVDALDYQRTAVRKVLESKGAQARLLIADAVGLGKTIEIGLILSELIRRGRGERILLVTPKHVLEQFQKEMWNKFAIPFVRLDSVGIQRIRQELPATRNPFTYYNRAIISIDTLKQDQFHEYLKNMHWDAVVVDEVHNVMNTNTQNNKLVRVLSANTDALIFASATPHNGRAESFAEIIRLLDKDAVQADNSIRKEDLERLVVCRHRHSQEVKDYVSDKWKERGEPRYISIKPSREENDVIDELAHSWVVTAEDEKKGSTKKGYEKLFGWTLVKAFLSSPAALDETIKNRMKVLKVEGDTSNDLNKLKDLQKLNEQVHYDSSEKFKALVDYLKSIGIKKNSEKRVVIFSERVATLSWLEEGIKEAFNLKDNQIVTMHGGNSDQEQMEIIERFKRKADPLRVLITGDVASEGVNLHAQCHDLIHWDIPWSLIRIQQRNGRIDRYGQEETPIIATLILDPGEDKIGDMRVFQKLVEREQEANATLGNVAFLMGKHSVTEEEKIVRQVLSGNKSVEKAVPETSEAVGKLDETQRKLAQGTDKANNSNSFWNTVNKHKKIDSSLKSTEKFSLYPSERAYLHEALNEAFDDHPNAPIDDNGVAWEEHTKEDFVSFIPTNDLRSRLSVLPQDYLRDRQVLDIIQLTDNRALAQTKIEAAQDSKVKANWPEIHFLSPLHPVTSWAADRALASMAREEIPVIKAEGDSVKVINLGTLNNVYGQVLTRNFTMLSFKEKRKIPGITPISDFDLWIRENTNLADANISNTSQDLSSDEQEMLQKYLNEAVHDASEYLSEVEEVYLRRFKEEEENMSDSQKERLIPKTRFVRPILVIKPL